jgi:hypothetical protein
MKILHFTEPKNLSINHVTSCVLPFSFKYNATLTYGAVRDHIGAK